MILSFHTKNRPITYKEIGEIASLQKTHAITPNSWIVKAWDIKGFDLSAKNPNKTTEIVLEAPDTILARIGERNANIEKLYGELRGDDLVVITRTEIINEVVTICDRLDFVFPVKLPKTLLIPQKFRIRCQRRAGPDVPFKARPLRSPTPSSLTTTFNHGSLDPLFSSVSQKITKK